MFFSYFYKRGNQMKKLIVILVIGMVLLMISGVFAESFQEKYKTFIDKIKQKKGIKEEDITNVTEVNFSDLNIENVGDTNLAIYKVEHRNGKPIFVLTSSEKVKKYQSPFVCYSKSFLNFGFNGEMDESRFLKTSTGVEGNLERGYVMMREGSITGISTNLDIINSNDLGWIEIIIYKNGEPIGFRNTLNAFSSGMKKDYDIQSKNTVMFEPGDIISVYIKAQEAIVWKDVITIVEVTIEN